MLRRREDLFTLAYVAAFAGLLILPYRVAIPLRYAFPYVALSALFSYMVCVVNHNHSHVRTFRAAFPNRAMDYLLSILRAAPCTLIVAIHNLNHHAELGRPEDFFSAQNAGEGIIFLRPFVYIRTTYRRFRGGWRGYRDRLGARRMRQIQRETWVALLALGAFFAMDWRIALAYVLLPIVLGNVGLVATNYFQHSGSDPISPATLARNFTDPVENFLFLNGGYHTIHHLSPSIHWADLPRRHAERLGGSVPRDLMNGSMTAYFWNRFVWRGFRRGLVD